MPTQSAENWVEEPPQRIPYVAKYVYDESTKEDSTQVVFITLTTLFVIIVICCLLEVYRSHLAYKRRIERETDEDIIWSKEQATKMHESPGVQGQPYAYKAVRLKKKTQRYENKQNRSGLIEILILSLKYLQLPVDEKKPGNGAPLVGILKNGNSASNGSIKRNGDAQIETRIEEEEEEDNEGKPTKPTDETSKEDLKDNKEDKETKTETKDIDKNDQDDKDSNSNQPTNNTQMDKSKTEEEKGKCLLNIRGILKVTGEYKTTFSILRHILTLYHYRWV